MGHLLQARWDRQLGDISRQSYTKILSAHAKGMCHTGKILPDKPETIFKAFKMCDWDNLKMVIISECGTYGNAFSGLSIGGPSGRSISHNTTVIERALKNIKGSTFNLHDYSMEYHAKQGILFLPVFGSLYVEQNTKKAEALKSTWKAFNKRVIKEIMSKKKGIVFLLLGHSPEVRELRDMASQLNTVYLHQHSIFFHIADINKIDLHGNIFKAFTEIFSSAIRKCDTLCDKNGRERITWQHKFK